MSRTVVNEADAALEILNVLVSIASATQERARQIAPTVTEISITTSKYETLETLAAQLQKTAIGIQRRLQIIQDAGAEFSVNRTLATRRLQDALTSATAVARVLDRD